MRFERRIWYLTSLKRQIFLRNLELMPFQEFEEDE
jgi:hypothetical protein